MISLTSAESVPLSTLHRESFGIKSALTQESRLLKFNRDLPIRFLNASFHGKRERR